MATIKDVAKKAGVSVSTVSYVMSGVRPISDETRQAVLRAIEELDYHPNHMARSLASKRTKIIALLYPLILSSYPDDIQLDFISSVAKVASHHNYGLLLFTTPSGEKDILRFIKEGLIDGLILMEVQVHDSRVSLMKELNFPFTLIGHCEDNVDGSYVDLDFFTALQLCVKHLSELGHHEIAFISTHAGHGETTFTYVMESMRGFEYAAAERGLSGVIRCTIANYESAYAMMNQLLDERPGVSAVICANDAIYNGVIHALQDRQLKVPEDVSTIALVSQLVAEKYSPKVTSLSIPSSEMGRLGAEFLIQRLDKGHDALQQVMLTPKLSVRQSTARLRQDKLENQDVLHQPA